MKAYKEFINDADWFIKSDDDTYLVKKRRFRKHILILSKLSQGDG